MEKYLRDKITVKDENGKEKEYNVEALFDMNDETYALIKDGNETLVMRVEDEEGEQYLVGIDDEEKKESILDAYLIAAEANPAE